MNPYSALELEVKQLAQRYKFDYKLTYDPAYCELVLDVVKHFVIGDQKTTEHTERHSRETLADVQVPVDHWWNYLKLAVVAFCPDLEFGWLAPEFYDVEVSCVKTIHHTTTYYNVCPAEDVGWRKELGVHHVRVAGIKPLEFLRRKPLTNDERERNLHDSYGNDMGRPIDEFPRPSSSPARHGDDWNQCGSV